MIRPIMCGKALRFIILWCMLMLAACHSFHGDSPRTTSLIPDGSLKIFPKYQISYADMLQVAGVMALVYIVVDPEAPNWEITETRVSDTRVLFNLRMKDFHLGGAGEAPQVLARRAETLSREQGMTGYQIQRYEESLDSRILFPHRTAYAEVLFLAANKDKDKQAKQLPVD